MDTQRLVGQQVDHYRIIKHIDRGGMADVYLAEDTNLKRRVAFKVLLELLAIDTQFVQRFQREGQTVAKLDHSNIVQVFGVGKTAVGLPYIAMQFIDGGSLRDKLKELARRGKLLTTEQALNIARQVAQALAVAHQARIVHRDLKPANVLIRPDGTPVLVDLGIAVVGGGPKLTQTGGIVGTPQYMSPEQVRSQQLDGRSDLYSLGIILYEMLAGTRPFEADDSIAVMHQQAYEEPPSLQALRPDLSPETLAIVEACLKKEPDQRFQRAEAIVTAIDQALRAEGSYGPNPQATQVLTNLADSELLSRLSVVRSPPGETGKPRRAIPLWAMATAVTLMVAIALVFILQSLDDEKVPSPPTVTTGLQAVVPDDVTAELTDGATTENTPVPNTAVPADLSTKTPQPTVTLPPPTKTSRPSEPTPTELPAAIYCPGAFPTRLSIGEQARVVNYQVNVRSGPGTQNSVVNRLMPGRQVDLLDGPECNDRQLWYRVLSEPVVDDKGNTIRIEGWVVEESGGEWLLEPSD